ncbi:hypothetical protein [Enterococcus sp. N249-2]
MKTYRMLKTYEEVEVYETKTFSKENVNELIDHLNKKTNLKKIYKIIKEDNPLHQKIINIHNIYAQFDDEYNDIFITHSILLPSIGENLPEEIEVAHDTIWGCTNDPASYLKSLVGNEYVTNLSDIKLHI